LRSGMPGLLDAARQQVEERLAEVEANVALDLKAMDGRVNAVAEASQSGVEALRSGMPGLLDAARQQVEERLAEVETNVALDLKAMDRRVNAAAEASLCEVEALRSGMAGVLDAAEQRTAQRVAALDAALAKFQIALPEAVRREVETRIAVFQAHLEGEIRAAVEKASELARQAAQARFDERFEERVAPLQGRAELQRATLDELRQSSEQSDRTVLELLSGIGRLCDEAARRMKPTDDVPAPPSSAGPTPEGEEKEVPLEPAPLEMAPAETAEVAETLPGVKLDSMLAETAEHPIPLFAQAKKPGRMWRIPLVSSFVATGLIAAALRFL
jgi:hypothetical protein